MIQQKRNRQPTKPAGPEGWQNFPIVAYTELDGRQVPIRSDKPLEVAATRALLLLENLPPVKHRRNGELATLADTQ
ncbi:MAG: hypothetical protein IPL32_19650 [Chloracidobacterium sp.]|nr:hypothetical protein [Chloracidobacterium sp.]